METKKKDYVGGLRDAEMVYESLRAGVRLAKGEQIRRLAGYDLFTKHELSNIVQTTRGAVVKALSKQDISVASHYHGLHGRSVVGRTLSVAKILAEQYHNKKFISASLLDIVFYGFDGLDYTSLERVTGIPESTAREVMYGGSYVSGVLRARPQP